MPGNLPIPSPFSQIFQTTRISHCLPLIPKPPSSPPRSARILFHVPSSIMEFDHLPSPFRIAIVGCGAIGSYYGARLAKAGLDVHFLLRSDHTHVSNHGLKIRSIDGDFALPSVRAYASASDIGPCDLVIIALKTTSNSALPALLAPLLTPETLLLTLQNGLGSDEFLAAHFGADRVLGGLCFVCINRTAPGEFHHSSQGLISLGEFSGPPRPRTAALCTAFLGAAIPCRVTPDLARERWKKLVWNVPFNGLSIAAGSITTDLILGDPNLVSLTRALMREVLAAAAALGHVLPDSLIEENISRTFAMDAYKPSSLIDFEQNREVEVESIWGEPFRRGQSAGAEVGRLECLYRLILRLTSQRLHPPAHPVPSPKPQPTS